MRWLVLSLGSLVCWSLFGWFNRRSIIVHGFNVSIAFNALVYLTTLVVLFFATKESSTGIALVTKNSFRDGMLGAVIGVGGLLLFNLAMREAADDVKAGLVILITGSFPVLGMVMGRVFWNIQLSNTQWLGVMITAFGIVLANWRK